MTLSLEHAFTITADIAEAREIGTTPSGYRRVIGITGGTVAGPVLNGEILSDGGDIIAVTNDGFGPGRDRDPVTGRPAPWTCPTRPCFETAAPALAWLNTTSFVGELRTAGPGQVTVDVHRVLVSAAGTAGPGGRG